MKLLTSCVEESKNHSVDAPGSLTRALIFQEYIINNIYIEAYHFQSPLTEQDTQGPCDRPEKTQFRAERQWQ
jgi:hypothetical protein